jgi:hypothetical protein
MDDKQAQANSVPKPGEAKEEKKSTSQIILAKRTYTQAGIGQGSTIDSVVKRVKIVSTTTHVEKK